MELNDTHIKIIKAMAKNDLNVSKASRELFRDRSSVLSHIEKIEDKTGLNPKKFYDLCKLLEIVEGVMP